jgi:hypothetical protein
MKIYIPVLLSITFAGALAASPIASESFSADAFAGGYQVGEDFGWFVSPLTNNRWVIKGNTGFSNQIADSALGWQSSTALIRPNDGGGLSHSLMPGPTSHGFALLRGSNSETVRQSRRQLATPLRGNEFYFSGLISMVNGLNDMRNGDRLLMGISNADSLSSPANFDNGFFIGLHKDEDKVYLSAFADGKIFQLGDPLTSSQAFGTSMIVLRVQLGTGRNNDTLTAWYALHDDNDLKLATTVSGLDIARSAAGLTHFGLISKTTGSVWDTTGGTAFDEMRLGTSRSSVVTR